LAVNPMEEIEIDSQKVAGVIDITTTEIGYAIRWHSARHGRPFRAVIRTRLPYIGTVGAVDMGEFRPCPQPCRRAIEAGNSIVHTASHADAHDSGGARWQSANGSQRD
jgi:uncharacterized protein (UPF0261 family)